LQIFFIHHVAQVTSGAHRHATEALAFSTYSCACPFLFETLSLSFPWATCSWYW